MTLLAVSLGDPSGVGPDIAIAAWLARERLDLPAFALIGDPSMLASRAKHLGIALPLAETDLAGAQRAFRSRLPVLATSASMADAPGESLPVNAAGVIEAIELGVDAVLDRRADALVTLPITKKSLYDAGFAFPGHTEFLGHLAGLRGLEAKPVMMLAGPELRTVPVTVHIPLARVPQVLSTDAIVEIGRIVAGDLRTRFKISEPRLALAGLNPHAGEGGSMGHEDNDIIAPAVALLRSEGIDARGPLSADTMFHPRARATYDAALCMYHDQALIPVKTIAFDETVNVTLGLPFIRTSPDHGTAFDIAGTGQARPDSFVAALRLAHRLALTASGR